MMYLYVLRLVTIKDIVMLATPAVLRELLENVVGPHRNRKLVAIVEEDERRVTVEDVVGVLPHDCVASDWAHLNRLIPKAFQDDFRRAAWELGVQIDPLDCSVAFLQVAVFIEVVLAHVGIIVDDRLFPLRNSSAE